MNDGLVLMGFCVLIMVAGLMLVLLWNEISEDNCISQRCKCEQECIERGYEYLTWKRGGYSRSACWCEKDNGDPIEIPYEV